MSQVNLSEKYFKLLWSESTSDRREGFILFEKHDSKACAEILPGLLENPTEVFLNHITILEILIRIGDHGTIHKLTFFLEEKCSDPTMERMVQYTLDELITKMPSEIEERLKHPHKKTVAFYISLAGKNRRKAAVPFLIKILQKQVNEPDQNSLMQVLIDSIGKIGCETAVKPLLDVLHGYGNLTTCQVVQALGEIGSLSPLEEIINLIGEDEIVNLTVIKALSLMGGEDAAKAIISFVSSDIPVLRNTALDGLVKIGTASLECLSPLLEASDSDVRILTLNVLGLIGEKKVLNQVIPLCRDEHPNVRVAAFGAFEKIGLPENRFILLRGFSDEEKEVRYAALSALESFPEQPIIESIIQASKWDMQVKNFFIEAVINLSAVNVFKGLHKDLELKDLLYKRLAELQHTDIFDNFKNMLDSDSRFFSEFNHSISKIEMHDTRFHILHVEDTLFIRRLVSAELQKMGYLVTSVNDGQEGLEVIESGIEVDLIISDINMPRMDGIELVKKIREKECWQSIPIIVNSTESQEIDLQIAIEAGANDYLVKPIDFERLQDLLEELFKNEGYKQSGNFLKNRRRCKRKKVGDPVSGVCDRVLLYGTFLNLSEDGMLIKVNKEVEHGSVLLIRFQLIKNDKVAPVKIQGVVIWVKKGISKGEYFYGIRFDPPQTEGSVAIKQFCEQV